MPPKATDLPPTWTRDSTAVIMNPPFEGSAAVDFSLLDQTNFAEHYARVAAGDPSSKLEFRLGGQEVG